MKRALVLLISVGLAACGGAADFEPATEPATVATAIATENAPTASNPGSAQDAADSGEEHKPGMTPVGEPVTPGSQGSEFPVDAAVQDLAKRLNVAPGTIEVQSVEKVIWRDASLGCPLPNVRYAQVLTEGYRIVLEAEGQLYPYHTDTRGSLVLCQSGMPELPVIPIKPGEIQDGQPWMPAGTVEPGEPVY